MPALISEPSFSASVSYEAGMDAMLREAHKTIEDLKKEMSFDKKKIQKLTEENQKLKDQNSTLSRVLVNLIQKMN